MTNTDPAIQEEEDSTPPPPPQQDAPTPRPRMRSGARVGKYSAIPSRRFRICHGGRDIMQGTWGGDIERQCTEEQLRALDAGLPAVFRKLHAAHDDVAHPDRVQVEHTMGDGSTLYASAWTAVEVFDGARSLGTVGWDGTTIVSSAMLVAGDHAASDALAASLGKELRAYVNGLELAPPIA